jgi:hypothetical protein
MGSGAATEGTAMTDPKTQSEKFKEAARELECDDDEARFNERIKKLVKITGSSLPSDSSQTGSQVPPLAA